MANKRKSKATKTKSISLKVAQSCLESTPDGKRRLNLSFKEVAVVPKCLQKLKNDVDELDLSRNLITKIPDFIGNFIGISVLDLHSNYLDHLPPAVCRLQNLQVLNLCNNRLSSLPGEVGLLAQLRVLTLGLNRLDSLPPSVGLLKELRLLGLSDNFFTRIPRCLSRLPRLETLNLDRNPILGVGGRLSPEALTVAPRGLYLVRESFLCEECRSRCRNERTKREEEQVDRAGTLQIWTWTWTQCCRSHPAVFKNISSVT